MSNFNFHIFPLLYAAPISYYAQWIKITGPIDKFENFQKQSFRNRCRIYGANGVISLSIPVKTTTKKINITEVEISNIEPWQRTHWRTLVSAYKSSPFFEYYAHLWEPLFEEQFNLLWDFNWSVHQIVLACLQLDIPDTFTHKFERIEPHDLRSVYSSKKAHPKAHSFPIYQQVFSYTAPFQTDLSILDAIFNLGPETGNYLQELDF
jgi:hypothetical protein